MIPFPAALQAPAPAEAGPLRAQYAWGYVGADGEGKGTLNLLLDPASGEVVLELQGVGERLMLLKGDTASGYHLQVPRRGLDVRSPDLKGLPLPFLPEVRSLAALLALVSEGAGPGVKVSRRDRQGPVKLRYQGRDEQGKDVHVWLERKVWQPAAASVR